MMKPAIPPYTIIVSTSEWGLIPLCVVERSPHQIAFDRANHYDDVIVVDANGDAVDDYGNVLTAKQDGGCHE